MVIYYYYISHPFFCVSYFQLPCGCFCFRRSIRASIFDDGVSTKHQTISPCSFLAAIYLRPRWHTSFKKPCLYTWLASVWFKTFSRLKLLLKGYDLLQLPRFQERPWNCCFLRLRSWSSYGSNRLWVCGRAHVVTFLWLRCYFPTQ